MLKVAWMTPYGESELWNPALRLRRKNVQENLQSRDLADTLFLMGYGEKTDDEVLSMLQGFDAVVMTEQSERDLRLSRRIKAETPAAVLRDHCEYVFGWPWQNECYSDADLIVCSSTVITEASRAHGFVATSIPDMYEPAPLTRINPGTEGLRAVFMGSGASLQLVNSPWASFIMEAGYTLDVITDVQGVGTKWDPHTWRDLYSSCDVAVVPQDVSMYPGKSSVKVAQALGVGLPVVCSPLPSYKEVITNGVNGFVVDNEDRAGWLAALNTLKDPNTRRAVSANALVTSKRFSPKVISDMWLEAIKRACAMARARDGV